MIIEAGAEAELWTTVPPEWWHRCRITDAGCIEWTRGTSGSMHYAAAPGGKLAHRVLWRRWFGDESPWLVIRRCHNVRCVRLSHCVEMSWKERFSTRAPAHASAAPRTRPATISPARTPSPPTRVLTRQTGAQRREPLRGTVLQAPPGRAEQHAG